MPLSGVTKVAPASKPIAAAPVSGPSLKAKDVAELPRPSVAAKIVTTIAETESALADAMVASDDDRRLLAQFEKTNAGLWVRNR